MKDKERNMKDKVLESEIRKHAEALAVALRKYTDEPMYFHLSIFTRDNAIEEDSDEIPDYYDFVLHKYDADDSGEVTDVVSKSFLIFYGEEGIRDTRRFGFRGGDWE